MTKNFETRVNREAIVDTRKYRYISRGDGHIYRLPLDLLDTTAACTGWKIVK